MEKKARIGFAFCGSFCTFASVIPQLISLAEANYEIIPIMSQTAYGTNTRFGNANEINNRIESICSHKIIHSLTDVEPIGPKKLTDLLILAPCTGNTVAKIANGISDTPVSLAAKSHMRNRRPVLIALASNDALGANAKNIGVLLNTKNIFFVPFRQDSPTEKPTSLISDMDLILPAAEEAMRKKQLQPVIIGQNMFK